MNGDNVKISAYQLSILLIVSVVGVGILTLPRDVAEVANTDGWLLILLAGVITIGLALIINHLANLFPNQTIIEYSGVLGGRPLSIIVGIILTVIYLIFSAFSVRIFGEVLKMYLLPRTPIEVVIISFLVTSSYLVRKGLEGMVRFFEIILWIMFIPYFLALFTGVSDVDFTNVLPIFQTSPLRMATGTLEIVFSFLGFELIFLFLPFVSDRGKMKRNLTVAITIITLIYVMTTVIVLASFGPYEIKILIWPLMGYIKSIQVPGAFIEQLEGVIMTIWVMFIFTTLSTMYLSSTFSLSRLLDSEEHGIYTVAVMPLIYMLSLLPDNVILLYEWLGTFSMVAGSIVAMILPILLLFLAKIRRKGVKGND